MFQFLQDISPSLLQHTAALVFYVDFTKAFDQLWHQALFYKLHQLNCPQQIFQFILTYLSNRQAYIFLNDLLSPVLHLEKGVRQGSCLEPILFLLYHCSLPQALPPASYTHLFADDLAIILTASLCWLHDVFHSNMQYLDQRILDELQNYALLWKQPLNLAQTEWQWIHRRVILPPVTFTLNNHVLRRTALFKYLGLYIDDKLSFNHHCHKMLKKIHQNSVILKYLNRSRTSSYKARLLLSNAYILPYFQLLYPIWPFISSSLINQIEATNRQIYRLIYNRWNTTNDEIRSLSSYKTASLRATTFLRRFLTKISLIIPDYLSNYILLKSVQLSLHHHFTEHRSIMALPTGRPNRHIRMWAHLYPSSYFQSYFDLLFDFLNQ